MYKVLIVEDEDIIRKGLMYTFSWQAHDCIIIGEASNGQDGLEKILELKPDIVITDINMPIMDGIKMIRNSIQKVNYSSIIISGYEEFHLAKQALQLEVVDYLLKPLDHEQLSTALSVSIQKLRAKAEAEQVAVSVATPTVPPNIVNPVSSMTSEIVRKIIDYITNNYKNKIVIQDLVEETGMSSTYLHNKFKEETNHTINDYLNRFRIQKSLELMIKGEGKIYTIATDVGFLDYKYFISVFKKYVKCTPSHFMKHYRNE
ncbi:response regulator [Bacillus sp. HMF5848]|uniref:response regulator transcription factor n=1 Tax=Bacillus sp. HMF5848 TaxID=2495421 RepID=UPI000F78D390|nr:response regulator [Bacillus sp. HMF5848]RSK28800.1 response regulator [Bacillus sp. HMF5848]